MSSFSSSNDYEVSRAKYPLREQVPFRAGSPPTGPYVDLRLVSPIRTVYLPNTVKATVDTGASQTVLTYEDARKWGIDPEIHGSRDLRPAILADGSRWFGRVCSLDIEVCGFKLKNVPVFIPLKKPDPSPEEQTKRYLEDLERSAASGKGPPTPAEGPNLLGREGVLNRILLCMDSEFVYLFGKSECVAGGSGQAGTGPSTSAQPGTPGSTA